ncbi:MAG: HlyD family efflux transporter periplasmic adaptor subunit, partial [Gammaproteobacteria bacterium]|nr:HlyD family efflux transporter periplasmic adaptor subunit [Gammaproteobacteria bacterium]
AEAQLARTVRDVRNLYATSSQLEAAVQMRQTELGGAQRDLARREHLAVTGAVSGEELQHAADAVKTAQAELLAAQQQLAANRARVDGTTLQDHPQVRDAAAAVRNAYLTLERTELAAPVAGFVARRNVQLGQRVSTGTALMSVVPLDQVWVDANFKEPQLARMRIGQPVILSADLYGRHVAYHGTVEGFGAGTGAAFSLLPAQNATGNWIKIVQRVPVRIALDPREIAAHPLQIGLSMKAEVDVKGGDGARLPQAASNQPTWTTSVSAESEHQAEARVQEIIAANESAPAHAPAAKALPASASRSAGPLVASHLH